MVHVLFRCPATAINVQLWLDDNQEIPENDYEGITCPACTRLHFINRKTGKLLNQDSE
jgi:hypothetical protein